MRGQRAALRDAVEFQHGSLPRLALKLYNEFRVMDEVSPLAIEGLSLEIIAEASRRSARISGHKKPPRWLELAKEMIHAQRFERLTLNGLAQAVGVHPVYLAREFRRHYRSTVGEYVRRLRIEFACHEIISTRATLVEIATASGFYDQSHFSKTFKRLVGVTPTEFRAAFRPR
jgi:AraC family transcriptional regulator